MQCAWRQVLCDSSSRYWKSNEAAVFDLNSAAIITNRSMTHKETRLWRHRCRKTTMTSHHPDAKVAICNVRDLMKALHKFPDNNVLGKWLRPIHKTNRQRDYKFYSDKRKYLSNLYFKKIRYPFGFYIDHCSLLKRCVATHCRMQQVTLTRPNCIWPRRLHVT